MSKTSKTHEPIKAAIRDRKSPVWDMSQERAFLENLLSQRFNYFLLFYSITVAGFVNAKNVIYAQIILTLGSVITYLFASVLRRSQQKLDIILDDLFKEDSHPAKIIDDLAKGCIGSKRRIIGVVIPTICYLTLFIGALLNLVYLIFIRIW
jgi:hypothetical protein